MLAPELVVTDVELIVEFILEVLRVFTLLDVVVEEEVVPVPTVKLLNVSVLVIVVSSANELKETNVAIDAANNVFLNIFFSSFYKKFN
jgi:hypothetical protein